MIVVDTNLIGYLFLSSDRSAQAEQALLRDPHWALHAAQALGQPAPVPSQYLRAF